MPDQPDPKPTEEISDKLLIYWQNEPNMVRPLIDALRATRKERDDWQAKHLKLLGSATRMTANLVTESTDADKRIAELEQFVADLKDAHNLEDVKRIAELEQQLANSADNLTALVFNYNNQSQRDRERIGELEQDHIRLNWIIETGMWVLKSCPDEKWQVFIPGDQGQEDWIEASTEANTPREAIDQAHAALAKEPSDAKL